VWRSSWARCVAWNWPSQLAQGGAPIPVISGGAPIPVISGGAPWGWNSSTAQVFLIATEKRTPLSRRGCTMRHALQVSLYAKPISSTLLASMPPCVTRSPPSAKPCYVPAAARRSKSSLSRVVMPQCQSRVSIKESSSFVYGHHMVVWSSKVCARAVFVSEYLISSLSCQLDRARRDMCYRESISVKHQWTSVVCSVSRTHKRRDERDTPQ
jgi:hypothetical protein